MRINHWQYWYISEDEENVIITSEITLRIFYKVVTLSKRELTLPLYVRGEDNTD